MASSIESTTDFAKRLADLQGAIRAARQAVGRSHALIARIGRSGDSASGPATSAVTTAQAFKTFNDFLDNDGIRPALQYLCSLTDYRYISVFRFQDGIARSAVHVDKERPEVRSAKAVPDTATYCRFVRADHTPFATEEASLDPRTVGHVARDVLQSYCGVPLLTPEGDLIGVLCYYDEMPRDPEQLDLELLLQAASALTQSGKVPPFPTD